MRPICSRPTSGCADARGRKKCRRLFSLSRFARGPKLGAIKSGEKECQVRFPTLVVFSNCQHKIPILWRFRTQSRRWPFSRSTSYSPRVERRRVCRVTLSASFPASTELPKISGLCNIGMSVVSG